MSVNVHGNVESSLVDVREVRPTVKISKTVWHMGHLKNYSALPVQCQDRFLGILILHGKTRYNRHIGGLVRLSKIEVYTVKHGINARRLFFGCAFYPCFTV